MNIKILTREEYKSRLRKELSEKGLYGAVKERCDMINEDARDLSYIHHMSIQESMVDILELIKMAGGKQE